MFSCVSLHDSFKGKVRGMCVGYAGEAVLPAS